MKKALIIAAALCFLAAVAPAQDYKFEVNRNVSWLVIDRHGQADLYYRLTFTCVDGAKPIDIVDIGLPNGSYRLESAQARIGADTLTDIRQSEYVKPYGVEVHLDQKTIMPGDSATLFFSIHLGQVLNRDDKDETYASFEFVPTWYGSEYVQGRTHLECNFVFPPGTRQDEPRYHGREFSQSWFDSSANAPIYCWTDEEASPDGQYKFGASFPSKYVDAASIKQPPGLLARIIGGIIALAGMLFTFLLSTSFFWIFGLIFFFAWRQNRARRMKYLPPQLAVEGVGIKRGLTAPEAALLLELPLDKVLAMVLFGLVKKGAVEVSEREPHVRVKTLDAARADQPYEKAFLDCVDNTGVPDPVKLRPMVVAFIKEVNDKLKGFSRKETVAYFRQIVSQAWDQVAAAGTPELKVKSLEENNDWMMMDPAYGDRVRTHYSTGYYPMPYWWGAYGHGHSGASTSAPAPAGQGPSVQMPKLPGADFANTIVGGTEKFAAGLVGGNVGEFTGKITNVTNPVPVSSSSGSSGGGGRSSCACACACAGCACACAGGGR